MKNPESLTRPIETTEYPNATPFVSLEKDNVNVTKPSFISKGTLTGAL